MFGHKSKPACIYKYGAKEPVLNRDAVFEQLFKAHLYHGKLVDSELERREDYHDILRRSCPELDLCAHRIEAAQAQIEMVIEKIRRNRTASRSRELPKALKKSLEAAKSELKRLWEERRELEKSTRDLPAVQKKLRKSSKAANARDTQARQEMSKDGLYWGTYLKKGADLYGRKSGDPPRYRRWRGEGSLAVQFQNGIPSQSLFRHNNLFWLERKQVKKNKAGTRTTIYATAHMRVSSDEKRRPVWTEFPVVLHRPLPEEAQVQWVYLTAKKVATKLRWSLCVVLAKDSEWVKPDVAQDGVVGIDLGWRVMPGGDVRVAYVVGDDGEMKDVRIPKEKLERWRQVSDLRAVRDKNFNEIRQQFLDWLRGHEVPDWLSESTRYLPHWRKVVKLAKICLQWRDKRFEGDSEMLASLEAWRKQDKHLYEWQENLHQKAREWRNNYYRELAAALSRRYRTVVFEKMSLAAMKKVKVEDESRYGRPMSQLVSAGIFRRFFTERFRETILVSPKNTTSACHRCASHVVFEDERQLKAACLVCGWRGDRDENGARNILARGLTRCKTPEPLVAVV